MTVDTATPPTHPYAPAQPYAPHPYVQPQPQADAATPAVPPAPTQPAPVRPAPMPRRPRKDQPSNGYRLAVLAATVGVIAAIAVLFGHTLAGNCGEISGAQRCSDPAIAPQPQDLRPAGSSAPKTAPPLSDPASVIVPAAIAPSAPVVQRPVPAPVVTPAPARKRVTARTSTASADSGDEGTRSESNNDESTDEE